MAIFGFEFAPGEIVATVEAGVELTVHKFSLFISVGIIPLAASIVKFSSRLRAEVMICPYTSRGETHIHTSRLIRHGGLRIYGDIKRLVFLHIYVSLPIGIIGHLAVIALGGMLRYGSAIQLHIILRKTDIDVCLRVFCLIHLIESDGMFHSKVGRFAIVVYLQLTHGMGEFQAHRRTAYLRKFAYEQVGGIVFFLSRLVGILGWIYFLVFIGYFINRLQSVIHTIVWGIGKIGVAIVVIYVGCNNVTRDIDTIGEPRLLQHISIVVGNDISGFVDDKQSEVVTC